MNNNQNLAPFTNSSGGPVEPAVSGKQYRALKLQSNGTAGDVTVIQSDGSVVTLHFEAGEIWPVTIDDITANTAVGLMGFVVMPS